MRQHQLSCDRGTRHRPNISRCRLLEMAGPWLAGLVLLHCFLRAEPVHGDGLLRVSDDARYLVAADGKPFVWIGDTAWHMADRLTREDVVFYLDDRKSRGCTLIQAAVFMGHSNSSGQTRNPKNAYGHRLFIGGDQPDPARPLVVAGGSPDAPRDYWDHVDFIVRETHARGLYLALLPCWGSHHINGRTRGARAVIFDEANARAYGEFLGARYSDKSHVVWVLGGDTNPDTRADGLPVYRAMAAGLVQGATGKTVAWNQPDAAWERLLITYHPVGPHSSSEFFHADAWLDFHMIQTFRYRERTTDFVTRDCNLTDPRRPVVMGEPAYEGDPPDPYAVTSTALDVRRQGWQSFFSGACGFTYGALKSGANGPLYDFAPGWKQCLELPGAAQLAGPLRRWLSDHPWWTYVPQPSVLAEGAGAGESRKIAFGPVHRRALYVYFPDHSSATLKLPVPLRQGPLRIEWFDPRTGARQHVAVDATTRVRLAPPGGWPDAVLELQAADPERVIPEKVGTSACGFTIVGRMPTPLCHPQNGKGETADQHLRRECRAGETL